MKHINEEDNYSKYYLKKYLQSGMGTLIFSQMTQIMKEPRYQLWPILVCKAKKPNISIIKITIQWWNDLETVNITKSCFFFYRKYWICTLQNNDNKILRSACNWVLKCSQRGFFKIRIHIDITIRPKTQEKTIKNAQLLVSSTTFNFLRITG